MNMRGQSDIWHWFQLMIFCALRFLIADSINSRIRIGRIASAQDATYVLSNNKIKFHSKDFLLNFSFPSISTPDRKFSFFCSVFLYYYIFSSFSFFQFNSNSLLQWPAASISINFNFKIFPSNIDNNVHFLSSVHNYLNYLQYFKSFSHYIFTPVKDTIS